MPPLPTTDELHQWLQAVAERGDRGAFAALFRHFAPRLKGFLVRSGCSEALAEELVQEAMVQLWRRAASFDPARARLSTWLYTIVRNLRIDQQRRLAARPGAEAATDDDAADDGFDALGGDAALQPEAQLLAAQRERKLRRALAALPPEQAQVLRLSFYEEHAHPAIARDLGIPLGTVKSRIRLAVAQLRRLLDGLEP
ncbi:MAG: sigma-70 family RNA polymerase sigma factor [Proteobacteria bacterium]|nr:sigma-70 family RNA polymerase sigma factor [Pseudomonadota bacterium]